MWFYTVNRTTYFPEGGEGQKKCKKKLKFREVTSLEGINGRSIQTLLRE